jgi:DHA3 family macrolide efflux protein-like MFS transporter
MINSAGRDGKAPPGAQAQSHARDRGVWNQNFLFLWEGQLVSALGDTVYAIALGFWILDVTGSTALMGTLMAATTLPRVLVSPLAGVVVDRVDRKRLLVFMDIVRGCAIVLIGLAALTHVIRVWMAFAAGVIIGVGGAFFSPGVNSLLPSMVPRDRLIQANSAFSLIYTGSGMLGNSAGGYLFQLLGAPLLFLFNGLSYLVSSLTLVFIRVHEPPRLHRGRHFFADLKEGVHLTWQMRGLRDLFFIAAILNFFGLVGITLILPLFQRTEGLGPARYGAVMACITGGMFVGFLSASAIKFKPAVRFRVFMFCAMVASLSLLAFALIGWFPGMLVFGFSAGVFNAILNSFIPATVQTVVPSAMIGKVSSLLMTLTGGLAPLAMASAGVLAEVIPIRVLMAASFGGMLLCFLPLFFARAFKRFITFDPARDTAESLISC